MLRKPIQKDYLKQIIFGEKEYEGRLLLKRDEWNLAVGKKIIFFDKNIEIVVKINELLEFSDFSKAYDKLGSKLIPNLSKADVIKLYNNLYHYENENISKFADYESSKMIADNGVIAIGLSVENVLNCTNDL